MTKKYSLLCMLITMSAIANAQSFIRVYNANGHKIARGRLDQSNCNDSTLVLKKGLSTDGIAIQNIAYIKTKHSVANNIMFGIALNVPLFIGFMTSNFSDYPSRVAFVGFAAGVAVGTIEGLASSAFKNSLTYNIKGDRQQWRSVRLALAVK